MRLARLLLVLGLAACSEVQEVWEGPGGPCNLPDYCVGPDELRRCSERRWAAISCDAECAAQGLGEGSCAGGFEGARCVCGSCVGFGRCVDAQTISTCEGEALPCAEHCAAQGFAASQGCTEGVLGGRCWCSASAACVSSESRCVSSEVLASCESGFQRITDCAAQCPGGVCTLDPDADHHRCACP